MAETKGLFRRVFGAADAAEPDTAESSPKPSFFARLRQGLTRSSNALSEGIVSVFTKRRLDEAALEEFEDLLIKADLGVDTAARIADRLRETRFNREVSDEEIKAVLAAEIEAALAPVARPLELDAAARPHVILVVGVNGTGKTTTIGKLAAKLARDGKSVMLAAGDTFRAAAIDQLKIWGERTNAPVVAGNTGADAAGLAFDALKQAQESRADVLIIDTAGRLQNKAELMAELEKIVRVLKKIDPAAPQTVLMTLDATTGQNAVNQVEIFGRQVGVTGLVMTKLDGTARGGVDDLEPFAAADFAKALAGLG
jgi:fused signal recognition particle receptor